MIITVIDKETQDMQSMDSLDFRNVITDWLDWGDEEDGEIIMDLSYKLNNQFDFTVPPLADSLGIVIEQGAPQAEVHSVGSLVDAEGEQWADNAELLITSPSGTFTMMVPLATHMSDVTDELCDNAAFDAGFDYIDLNSDVA